MSYSDNIESTLKNLEAGEETFAQVSRGQAQRNSDRARQLAIAPHAERLKQDPFTAALLDHAVKIGHGLRAKVWMTWIGTTLRLEVREHRLELRPTPEGVIAVFIVNGKETGREPLDFRGNAEQFARRWLQSVGPRTAA